MKKLSSIIILVSFCALTIFSKSGIAQNIANLDLKYGIKKFKLGTSYELYKSQLLLIPYNIKNANLKTYKYLGSDIPEIFGYEVKAITLIFYKNCLFEISIEYPLKYKEFEVSIANQLKILFGEWEYQNDIVKGYGTTKWSYYWQGKKTFLAFDYTTDKDVINTMSIWMVSTLIQKQIANDQF